MDAISVSDITLCALLRDDPSRLCCNNWKDLLEWSLEPLTSVSGTLLMSIKQRPKLFKYRHNQPEIILLCLRWYLRYSLSYRDLEAMTAERGPSVYHTTIYRWVQHYAPILEEKCRAKLKLTNDSWRVDETRHMSRSKWNGYICTEQWTQTGIQSSSCSAQPEMDRQPSACCAKP